MRKIFWLLLAGSILVGMLPFLFQNSRTKKYKISESLPQKPLVVIIPSYNNAQWYQKNLDSVRTQQYENYRVIYIDDCSTDGTADLVEQYITKYNLTDKFTLVKNKTRRRALANHHTAVHMCADQEIIVQLDGDDWFKHDQVLQRVNQAYADPAIWLTYGQYEEFPSGKVGRCKPMLPAAVVHNCHRECSWVTSALRTFYAGLFKQIKLQDLLYQGDFFTVACDLAFMFPMIEMAKGHVQFIDEVLYVYNRSIQTNDDKIAFIEQVHADNVIRARSKYEPLEQLPLTVQNPTIALIIRGIDDAQLRQSITTYATGIDAVYTIQHEHELAHLLTTIDASHIMLTHDRMQCIQPIDVRMCAQLLQQTKAHSFHIGLDFDQEPEKPPLTHVHEDIYVWQFADAAYAWRAAYNWNMTLYPKEIITSIAGIDQAAWPYAPLDARAIALCCRIAACCAK
ncbi:MAG TPA: glycosyltransferase family 2 protein [Candidatus Dependentiae bacterium]|nr:glycosyltransferase family 2 protein [Candidatus Dependentiae bacterium]HRQ63099.1 glycosyltransferase family 2 protein [Candidatus Dependentiae bacterium]